MNISKKSKAKPILVTGSHRSGTTWIGKMISASPSVAYIHEPFNPCISKIFPGICGIDFNYWYEYVTYENEAKYYPEIKKTLNFRYDLNKQIASYHKLRDYKRTIKEYLSFYRYRLSNSVPLIKDPFTLFSAEWLAEKFDMNVVITIRHPASFISSLQKLNWSYDFSHFLKQPLLMKDHLQSFEAEIIEYSHKKVDLIDQASLIWRIIYQTVSNYIAKYPNWIYLRYEDVARQPITSFEKLFQKLNLDFSNSVQTTVQNYCQPSNPSITPDSDYYLIKVDSKAHISSWKNRLTDLEIKRIRNQVETVSSNFYADNDW